jgi:hypothetical protein
MNVLPEPLIRKRRQTPVSSAVVEKLVQTSPEPIDIETMLYAYMKVQTKPVVVKETFKQLNLSKQDMNRAMYNLERTGKVIKKTAANNSQPTWRVRVIET